MSTFKTIRILGKRHRVEWNAKIEEEGCGEFHPPVGKLRVAGGMSHDEERETLLHECLHAVMYQIGCEVPEVKHRPFSCAMYALLKDNPKLTQYLLQEEPDADD